MKGEKYLKEEWIDNLKNRGFEYDAKECLVFKDMDVI